MVSAIGPSGIDWSTPATGPSGIDWSNGASPLQDLSDFFSSAVSGVTSTLSTATTNELNGLVNNAADAAAKRLGVSIPSSSSSTVSNSSSSRKSSTTKTGTTSSSGQNIASRNIDQLLATLDGHPPAASTSSTSTGAKFDLNSFLGGLDKITAGNAAGKATTPKGKNFSIDSYLQTLDAITPHSPSVLNVTT